MKRSGKFYYKNERETLEAIGLKQVKGSGNGWVEKEDGQNEEIICQLKSTDAESMRVKKRDIDILVQNAYTVHKVPVFAIQFLEDNDVWLMVKPEDILAVAENLQLDKSIYTKEDEIKLTTKKVKSKKKKVKSSKSSREAFHEEESSKYRKDKSAK